MKKSLLNSEAKEHQCSQDKLTLELAILESMDMKKRTK